MPGSPVQAELARRELPLGSTLVLTAGSVIDFGADHSEWPKERVAIVNAANVGGLGGGGVDGAITRAGGPQLAADRMALPILSDADQEPGSRIRLGGSVLTGPGNYGSLYAGNVIHSVGPNYNLLADHARGDNLLRGAYKSAMSVAAEAGIEYLGVSLLSAGIFRGACTVQHVLRIALEEVRDGTYRGLKEVHLVCFLEEEQQVLLGLLGDVFVKSDRKVYQRPTLDACFHSHNNQHDNCSNATLEGRSETPNEESVAMLIRQQKLTSDSVAAAFRAVDRAAFVPPEYRGEAYQDTPLRNQLGSGGFLHLSAPHMYAFVLEAMDLKPGMSVLNVGSGTGYLSSLVALMTGPQGMVHGVELFPDVVEYARTHFFAFRNSYPQAHLIAADVKFVSGNIFQLDVSNNIPYDRVYVGAGAAESDVEFFQRFLHPGGLLVGCFGHSMLRIHRGQHEQQFTTKELLAVRFAELIRPAGDAQDDMFVVHATDSGRQSAMADEEEVTIFYVHKDTGEKLWDGSPPAGEEHLYETWEFDAATGEVSHQVAAQPTGPRPPPVEDPPGMPLESGRPDHLLQLDLSEEKILSSTRQPTFAISTPGVNLCDHGLLVSCELPKGGISRTTCRYSSAVCAGELLSGIPYELEITWTGTPIMVGVTDLGFDPRSSKVPAHLYEGAHMYWAGNGRLWAKGEQQEWPGQCAAKRGDRIKLELDLVQGSLSVKINDNDLGAIVDAGLTGPLRWTVDLFSGTTARIGCIDANPSSALVRSRSRAPDVLNHLDMIVSVCTEYAEHSGVLSRQAFAIVMQMLDFDVLDPDLALLVDACAVGNRSSGEVYVDYQQFAEQLKAEYGPREELQAHLTARGGTEVTDDSSLKPELELEPEPEPKPEPEFEPEPELDTAVSAGSKPVPTAEGELTRQSTAQTIATLEAKGYRISSLPSGASEKDLRHRDARGHPKYLSPASKEACMLCESLFGMLKWRYICRNCGWVVCHNCSTNTLALNRWVPVNGRSQNTPAESLREQEPPVPKRVCDTCYKFAPAEMEQRKQSKRRKEEEAAIKREQEDLVEMEKVGKLQRELLKMQKREAAERKKRSDLDAAVAATRKAEAEQQAKKAIDEENAERAKAEQAHAERQVRLQKLELATLKKEKAEHDRLEANLRVKREKAAKAAIQAVDKASRLEEARLKSEKKHLEQQAITAAVRQEVARQQAANAAAESETQRVLAEEHRAEKELAEHLNAIAQHAREKAEQEQSEASARHQAELAARIALEQQQSAIKLEQARLLEEQKHLRQREATEKARQETAKQKAEISAAEAETQRVLAAEQRAVMERKKHLAEIAQLEEDQARQDMARWQAEANLVKLQKAEVAAQLQKEKEATEALEIERAATTLEQRRLADLIEKLGKDEEVALQKAAVAAKEAEMQRVSAEEERNATEAARQKALVAQHRQQLAIQEKAAREAEADTARSNQLAAQADAQKLESEQKTAQKLAEQAVLQRQIAEHTSETAANNLEKMKHLENAAQKSLQWEYQDPDSEANKWIRFSHHDAHALSMQYMGLKSLLSLFAAAEEESLDRVEGVVLVSGWIDLTTFQYIKDISPTQTLVMDVPGLDQYVPVGRRGEIARPSESRVSGTDEFCVTWYDNGSTEICRAQRTKIPKRLHMGTGFQMSDTVRIQGLVAHTKHNGSMGTIVGSAISEHDGSLRIQVHITRKTFTVSTRKSATTRKKVGVEKLELSVKPENLIKVSSAPIGTIRGFTTGPAATSDGVGPASGIALPRIAYHSTITQACEECNCKYASQYGVTCTSAAGPRHFLCDQCFTIHVHAILMDLFSFECDNGVVKCPACSCQFDEVEELKHLPADLCKELVERKQHIRDRRQKELETRAAEAEQREKAATDRTKAAELMRQVAVQAANTEKAKRAEAEAAAATARREKEAADAMALKLEQSLKRAKADAAVGMSIVWECDVDGNWMPCKMLINAFATRLLLLLLLLLLLIVMLLSD